MKKKVEILLFITWFQAFLATFGSLFFSEVLNFIPCEKCWYQRILMYPQVLLYGLALFHKDLRYAQAGLYLSGIGIVIAAYHYGLQKIPALHAESSSCGVVPCDGEYINLLGFITIPFLSLIAFTVIFVMHMWMRKELKKL
ncbi:disulfide oxidoreductase [Pontibacillus yanchengensis]|uniref:Probable disulfide formation protein n=1 Tax=Pontibacillus yanchengensis Y32 TaxID=1385514 RepID=A0A0A2TBU6_9BACI|nr:disulfide oxidoreductase [Pontibacillus yanchengensis]KGP71561.1 disulfide formation protein [Pontibacillus yanchengensis Y32]